jgi:hypothetical protein
MSAMVQGCVIVMVMVSQRRAIVKITVVQRSWDDGCDPATLGPGILARIRGQVNPGDERCDPAMLGSGFGPACRVASWLSPGSLSMPAN